MTDEGRAVARCSVHVSRRGCDARYGSETQGRARRNEAVVWRKKNACACKECERRVVLWYGKSGLFIATTCRSRQVIKRRAVSSRGSHMWSDGPSARVAVDVALSSSPKKSWCPLVEVFFQHHSIVTPTAMIRWVGDVFSFMMPSSRRRRRRRRRDCPSDPR